MPAEIFTRIKTIYIWTKIVCQLCTIYLLFFFQRTGSHLQPPINNKKWWDKQCIMHLKSCSFWTKTWQHTCYPENDLYIYIQNYTEKHSLESPCYWASILAMKLPFVWNKMHGGPLLSSCCVKKSMLWALFYQNAPFWSGSTLSAIAIQLQYVQYES